MRLPRFSGSIHASRRVATVAGALIALAALALPSASAQSAAGSIQPGASVSLTRSAVVNLTDLARQERLRASVQGTPPVRPLIPSELNEQEEEGTAPSQLVPPGGFSI